MQIITVQDNDREKSLAELFGLKRNVSRIDVDANDSDGHDFELKTTTRSVVSTARDFGRNHINKWRNRYWLIAKGQNYDTGFVFEKIYFLAPVHMSEWYNKHLVDFDRKDRLISRVVKYISGKFSEDECVETGKMMGKGAKLNDPGILWSYVESHGILIDDDYKNKLKGLIEQFPMGEIEEYQVDTEDEVLICIGDTIYA